MTASVAAPPMTFRELRDDCLDILGDTVLTPADSRVWTEAQIEGYIRDGYREFCYRTKILWDMRHVDDLPYTSNYDFAWEKAYFRSGEVIHNRSTFTAPDDKDYQGDSLFAGNHQYLDERDYHLTADLISPTERLPDAVLNLDRVTWDGYKILPITTRELRREDNLFETVKGRVFGYLQDKDGLRTIRKWRVPSARAAYYKVRGLFGIMRGSTDTATSSSAPTRMHIDEWAAVFSGALDAAISLSLDFSPGASTAILGVTGPITDISEFASDRVNWRYGVLRRLPGYFPANGPHGFVKRISQDSSNTRIEFVRRPATLSSINDIFEILNYMLKYVRAYALKKAYSKQGVGQDLKLAAHYDGLFEQGVARTTKRVQSIYRSIIYRMGGSPERVYGSKPYARLPRNI